MSSISAAQPHPRALEDSCLVDLFTLEDDLYPLEGHYRNLGTAKIMAETITIIASQ